MWDASEKEHWERIYRNEIRTSNFSLLEQFLKVYFKIGEITDDDLLVKE